MADDEGGADVPVTKVVSKVVSVASADELTAAIARAEDRLVGVSYVSNDCPLCTTIAVPFFEEYAAAPENEKIVFIRVSLDSAADCAALAGGIGELPAWFFYHEKQLIESFTGSNVEKVKLMCRGAVVRRTEVVAAREKAKEEEERVRKESEAAAAAAA